MNFRRFLDWLLSDAGAGWIIGLVAWGLLVKNWVAQKREQKVLCTPLDRLTLYEGRGRIQILFDDKPTKKVSGHLIELENIGREVIKDIRLALTFPAETTVLDSWWEATPPCVELDVTTSVSANRLQIRVPYLNPARQHGQRIRIRTLVDGDVGNVKIVGGGEGWSLTVSETLTAKQIKIRSVLVSCLFSAGIFACLGLYALLLRRRYGLSLQGIWLALSPVPLFVLGATLALLRYGARLERIRTGRRHKIN